MFTFLLFSASKFQLPHYLNIVYPFFAIITAQYLYRIKIEKSVKAIRIIQTVIIVLLLLVVGVLHYFYRPETFTLNIGICLFILLLALLLLPQVITNKVIPRIILRTLLASFFINLYFNTVFYTSLLYYQSGSEAAMWINRHNPQKLPLVQIKDDYVSAMNFYSDEPVITVDAGERLPRPPFILYADSVMIKDLSATGLHIQPLKTYQRYWISRLKPAFLNRSTRDKELTTMQVVIVDPNQ